MITVIAFIVTIGIIVAIHEYGHFQVARWCGVKVLRFSIGFGKPLWRKTFGKDQTEFVLSAVPLGGFVKMLDENELKAEAAQSSESKQILAQYSEADLARAFNRQSVYKRIAIVLAGPVANLLLAILVYWVLLLQGVVGMQPIIGQVDDGSPAAQANFATGEVIEKIDGKPIKTWSDARWALLEASLANKQVQVEAANAENEVHLHTLDLNGIDQDAEVDVLRKVGLNAYTPDVPAVIDKVLTNGAAESAGIIAGDKILSIDHTAIDNWADAVGIIQANPDALLQFKVQRKREKLSISVKPKGVEEAGGLVGKIGASVKINQKALDAILIKQHFSPLVSLSMAVEKTWKTSIFSLKMLWKMLVGQVSWKSISGPVTIASYAGETAGLGVSAFLGFLALISISVGVLNLLPIPVLDGGHLMYYMAEIIKGSPVSESVMLAGQKVGFAILGVLMAVAFVNDINRIVG